MVKFSKSGTPAQIYRYHGLHPEGIAEACGQALAETALERVRLQPAAAAALERMQQQGQDQAGWKELWPDPA